MIAPAMFPQLGILDEPILHTSNSTPLDLQEFPAGVYKLEYGGGGGGGGIQYFGYTWEQGSGEKGSVVIVVSHVTTKSEIESTYTLGSGGLAGFDGGDTYPMPHMTKAEGGSVGMYYEGFEGAGRSTPVPAYAHSGVKSLNQPQITVSTSTATQGGRGYKNGTGAAQAGKDGYIKIKRISQ